MPRRLVHDTPEAGQAIWVPALSTKIDSNPPSSVSAGATRPQPCKILQKNPCPVNVPASKIYGKTPKKTN